MIHDVIVEQINNQIYAKIDIDTKEHDHNIQFAFYLLKNDERISIQWYTSQAEHTFEIQGNGIYKVIGFVKKNDKVYQKISKSIFIFDTDYYISSITQNEFLKEQAYLFKIRNFSFPLLFFPKQQADSLTILLSAAVNRKLYNPPIFNRWSWKDLFPGHVIAIADPTLFIDKNLELGWYIGTEKHDCMIELMQLILYISKILNIPNDKIIFYGSSGGGFASLMLASLIEGSLSVAINPQTNILKYEPKHVQNFLNICFPQTEKQDYWRYENRFSLFNFWKTNQFSKILYVQNTQDIHHFNKHFLPFSHTIGLSTTKGYDQSKRFYSLIYSNENGHGPEPDDIKPEIFQYINTFLKK